VTSQSDLNPCSQLVSADIQYLLLDQADLEYRDTDLVQGLYRVNRAKMEKIIKKAYTTFKITTVEHAVGRTGNIPVVRAVNN
jgi:hypothetical protein